MSETNKMDKLILNGQNIDLSPDYQNIRNKPTINGISVDGDKTLDDYGLATKQSVEDVSKKLDKLPYGMYYGQYDDVESLPNVEQFTEKGYAYVATTEPNIFYIYVYNGEGEPWQDSGNKFDTGTLESNLDSKSKIKPPTTKAVKEGIEAVDITATRSGSTELSAVAKYNAAANINDRAADAVAETGVVKALGYKVLDKRKRFDEQVEGVNNANTIFEIKDSFDLGGGSVTIPTGCTLRFNGGSIGNGTIIGTNTLIEAPDTLIFKQGIVKRRGYKRNNDTSANSSGNHYKFTGSNVIISGTWNNLAPSAAWVGLKNTSDDLQTIDCSFRITNYIKLFKEGVVVRIPKGEYGVYQFTIQNKIFDGGGSVFRVCAINDIVDLTIPLNSDESALDTTYWPKGLDMPYQVVTVVDGTAMNFTIDGERVPYTDIKISGNWGTKGLIGIGGLNESTLDGISLLNSYMNGLLGIGNNCKILNINNCYIDSTIEHGIYARPNLDFVLNISNTDICRTGTNKYLAETDRANSIYSIKLVLRDPDNVAANKDKVTRLVNLDNVNIRADEGYSIISTTIVAKQINMTNCHIEKACHIHYHPFEKECTTIICNGCTSIPIEYNSGFQNTAIWYIYNCTANYKVLSYAVKIENSELVKGEDSTPNVLNPNPYTADILNKLEVNNCVIKDYKNLARIIGKKSILFSNTEIKNIIFLIMTDGNNTVPEDDDWKIEFNNCTITINDMKNIIPALRYKIFVLNSTISANYASNAAFKIFDAKELWLSNVNITPTSTGLIPRIANNNVIHHIFPFNVNKQWVNDSSFYRGQTAYNDHYNKQMVFDGNKWVLPDNSAPILMEDNSNVDIPSDYGGSSSVIIQCPKYLLLDTEPDDWDTGYTNYYTRDGNTYTKVPAASEPPAFVLNAFYKEFDWTTILTIESSATSWIRYLTRTTDNDAYSTIAIGPKNANYTGDTIRTTTVSVNDYDGNLYKVLNITQYPITLSSYHLTFGQEEIGADYKQTVAIASVARYTAVTKTFAYTFDVLGAQPDDWDTGDYYEKDGEDYVKVPSGTEFVVDTFYQKVETDKIVASGIKTVGAAVEVYLASSIGNDTYYLDITVATKLLTVKINQE